MTELATLARPYAEAAFMCAKQSANTGEWSDSLSFLAAAMQTPELIAIVENPRVSRVRISDLLLDISQDHVTGAAKNLLKLLVENDKLKLLSTISAMFEQHKAEDEGYVNVDLVSAYSLTKSEQGKYVAMLEKLLNKKVNANVTIDKSLIGGIVAKAGDKVIDGSISGQLNQLAKRL
jgi:F-type H+-transporting ATPase subunit delta